ncbi:hypothetical protein A6S26_31675 [Nostoc sp. ATCC 43529]|nr:hypothetical protein A6S26_31675 [Nostoc sp. ATCC 43529]
MTVTEPHDSRFYFVHQLLRAQDYQDRPEFNKICDWWKSGGTGVLALVGIGGAGKTALTERFLRVLPGVFPDHPNLPKDESLPTPQRLFVFSFYDAPNPDIFFAQLHAWLQGRSYKASGARPAYQRVLETIQAAPSLLLILDGLEKVQSDGSRGGFFGGITHGALREFVERSAEGYFPHVRLLITTRFPLEDLEYKACPFHQKILVESISRDAAISLLRRRGVQGSDLDLQQLAERCGLHALTIDLAGGYIAHFGQGNPNTPLEFPSSEELRQIAEKNQDRRLRYVAQQSARFARVAERYRDALQRSDPAALALLERVCLFRLGVTAQILTNIFTGEEKKGFPGVELAQLTLEDVKRKLNFLIDMHILEKSSDNTYAIHPAVRDGFRAGLNVELAQRGHDEARKVLENSLGQRPGGSGVPDPSQLDLLEEIVYHTIQAGYLDEAHDLIYDTGIEILGFLGYFEQGKRIFSEFIEGKDQNEFLLKPKMLSVDDWIFMLFCLGACHSGLGDLASALLCYRSGLSYLENNQLEESRVKGALEFLKIENSILRNRLTDALTFAELVTDITKEQEDPYFISIISIYRGRVRFLLGLTKPALADFKYAQDFLKKQDNDNDIDEKIFAYIILFGGDFLISSLLRFNSFQEALDICLIIIKYIEEIDDNNIKAYDIQKRLNVILAEICIAKKELAQASQYLHQAHDWAIERGAKELLCCTAIVQARLALAEAQQSLQINQIDQQRIYLQQALKYIDEGLYIARSCGYGIYHIDLLIVQAQTHLLLGLPKESERDMMIALYGLAKPVGEKSIYAAQVLNESSQPEERGIFPPEDSGLPELLAATHSESGYAWGEGDARHLLAEALLLQAAQSFGAAEFVPARRQQMPKEVQRLIELARKELQSCLEIRQRIQDPKLAQTEQVFQDLEGGILTNYPLHRIELPQETEAKLSTINATTQSNDRSKEHEDTNDKSMNITESYINFDLHIAPDGHTVARSFEGEATARISTDIPDNIRLSSDLIKRRGEDEELLKSFGQELYNWLFPSAIHAHFQQTEAVANIQNSKIRLRLQIEAEKIASLPLEFIYRNLRGYFFAVNPNTVLSRYLNLPFPPNRRFDRDSPSPLHVLAIIANPTDQTPLSVDEWGTILQESLCQPLKNGLMTLQILKQATRKDIRNALLRQKPDIIQFVGHGIYQNSKGYLALVDEETSKTWLVNDEQFADIFMGYDDHLKLVSLATCESAMSENPQGFLGIAPKLVQRGIPAVLSMQYKVYIKTAKVFLEDFYAAIAARKPIDWATQSARKAISSQFGLNNREFATPVLYMRIEDGNVF